MKVDWEFALLRALLGVVGLGLAIWRVRAHSSGRDPRRRLRVSLLALAGILSYASYYFFFQLHFPHGFEPEDTFHYYVGSKYFPELGYYGLYDATLMALVEAGVQEPDSLDKVRNLKDMRTYPPGHALARASKLRRSFSDERWAGFRRDVSFFRARMSDAQFTHLMLDHGYNPPPVWTWLGRVFSTRVDPGPRFVHLVRADRGIVLLALLVCTWGFGVEIGALAAIAWGTGFLWRYGWVGDSFLRQLWLGSALIGLALARRGWFAASGASLALSGLLRIFPGIFAAGWLAHASLASWRTRRLAPGCLRFALGAGIAGIFLVGASLGVSSEPGRVYPAFIHKISRFQKTPALNKIGLGVLEQAALQSGPRESIAGTAVTRPRPAFRLALTALRWLCVGAALFLFARALRRSDAWESAAASAALIPLLTDPTGYYYAFSVAGILLAERRPRIAVWVLGACAAWAAAGLIFYREPASYVLASAIAVVLSFGVLAEWGRPVRPRPRPRPDWKKDCPSWKKDCPSSGISKSPRATRMALATRSAEWLC